jgi:hypothetical protein
MPDGSIGRAEVRIDDPIVIIGEGCKRNTGCVCR